MTPANKSNVDKKQQVGFSTELIWRFNSITLAMSYVVCYILDIDAISRLLNVGENSYT